MDARRIHFAIVNGYISVAPLCGKWENGTAWTTAPGAVTCLECLRRLEVAKRGEDGREQYAT